MAFTNTIIEDQFTGMANGDDIGGRTPSPTDNGSTWNESPGANDVEGDGSGRIKFSAAQDNCSLQVAGHGDIAVECDWVSDQSGGADDNRCTIDARSDNADLKAATVDKYNFNFRMLDSAAEYKIYRNDNGSSTELASVNAGALTPSQTYKVRIECEGSTIRGLVDGAEVISASDSTYATGDYVGFLHAKWVATADGRMDNFKVQIAAAAATLAERGLGRGLGRGVRRGI